MVRVTKLTSTLPAVTLKVEGQIVGESAAVLDRECATLLATTDEILLDLSAVTYIDTDGLRTLRRIAAGRLIVVNCSPLIREMLREEA